MVEKEEGEDRSFWWRVETTAMDLEQRGGRSNSQVARVVTEFVGGDVSRKTDDEDISPEQLKDIKVPDLYEPPRTRSSTRAMRERNEEDISLNQPKVVKIPTVYEPPRTRSGTRSVREGFNLLAENVSNIATTYQDQEDEEWPMLKTKLGSTLFTIIQTEPAMS